MIGGRDQDDGSLTGEGVWLFDKADGAKSVGSVGNVDVWRSLWLRD